MIDKYALGAIEFELLPDGANAALDKDGRATVFVYLDWFEFEFVNAGDWKSTRSELLPRIGVVEIHRQMCEEILSEMSNSDEIAFYLRDRPENENGSLPWTTYLRMPDYYTTRIVKSEPLTLMVSVDADEDGAPTRDALTRLRRVVAEARDRYDERVEEWYWSDPDIP